MTHLITVHTQRNFLVLQCPLTLLFFVLLNISHLYIFQHLSIFCHTLLLYCGPLCRLIHCECRWWFSLQKSCWSVGWLISSYQAIHAVRLFVSCMTCFFPLGAFFTFFKNAIFVILQVSGFEWLLLEWPWQPYFVYYIFSKDKHGTF